MSAAVCTRESAPIHWHLRVESGGFKKGAARSAAFPLRRCGRSPPKTYGSRATTTCRPRARWAAESDLTPSPTGAFRIRYESELRRSDGAVVEEAKEDRRRPHGASAGRRGVRAAAADVRGPGAR